MLYWTCERCGANLDPGEPCDCRDEGSATDGIYRTKKEAPTTGMYWTPVWIMCSF